MMMVLRMFGGTVVRIVNSKILVQMVVCYFVTDTLVLDEYYYFHHPRTWCCPMPQNFVTVRSTNYKILTQRTI